jgi:hypothetical protein
VRAYGQKRNWADSESDRKHTRKHGSKRALRGRDGHHRAWRKRARREGHAEAHT